MKPAICLEHIGKRYALRHEHAPRYNSLRDTLAQAIRRPDSLLRKAQRCTEHAREEFWALRNITLDIGQGERIGLIGRNGAGKTTLLKLISRITSPTEGRILLKGRVGTLLEVGTGFHPELTGRENIYLNGAILGMRKNEIRRKFDEIVSFAEIEKFLDMPVKQYSSGMYIRLAFAVAAHLETDILLVDEVLAVGDFEFQKKCLGKMNEISQLGSRTILFVSHNLGAIKRLCSRSLVFHKGELLFDGDSQEGINFYLNHNNNQSSNNLEEQISRLQKDKSFNLKNIIVFQDNNENNVFFNNKSIIIKFEYDLLDDLFGFHVYFQLCDLEGNILFESINDGNSGKISLFIKGHYNAVAYIPANFLNANHYELRFFAGIHNNRSCLQGDLSCQISVLANGVVNSSYPEYKSPGTLLPEIFWTTELANEL